MPGVRLKAIMLDKIFTNYELISLLKSKKAQSLLLLAGILGISTISFGQKILTKNIVAWLPSEKWALLSLSLFVGTAYFLLVIFLLISQLSQRFALNSFIKRLAPYILAWQ